MSVRGRGKIIDNDEEDTAKETGNEQELVKDEKKLIKNVVGNTSAIKLNLKPVTIGKEKLKKILTKGVPSFCLKLILSSDYLVFNSEIIDIEKRLFEYPIGEVIICESSMQLVSNLQIPDLNKFRIKSVAIFLIDTVLLSEEKYNEILLALHSQEEIIDIKGNNLVHLVMNINL